MKKFIYSLLLAASLSLSFYSCTEEQIKPKADGGNGGAAYQPILK